MTDSKKRYRPKSATKEMFKNRNHITHLLLTRAATIASKRRLVALASGELFYIFGYELKYEPWKTYDERYC